MPRYEEFDAGNGITSYEEVELTEAAPRLDFAALRQAQIERLSRPAKPAIKQPQKKKRPRTFPFTFKIRIDDPDGLEDIQRGLLSLGCRWVGCPDNAIREKRVVGIVVRPDGVMNYITKGPEEEIFNDLQHHEFSGSRVAHFLAQQGGASTE
jgi:hypothetical protein